MNLLCLDVGEKYIGVAIADTEAALIAVKKGIIEVAGNEDAAIDKVLAEIKQNRAEVVVVGLPRSLSGNETAQSKLIREFTCKLKSKLTKNISVEFADETLSSVEAKGINTKSKERVDDRAAAIILQNYLDLNFGGWS